MYRSTANAAAGAWVLVGSAATSFATRAEANTGTSTTKAVPPAYLYFPTGHLWGLTLSNNGSDASNDIDIAVGTCRDATDTINMVQGSALTKQIDAAWVVGNNQGGLDTGSVANTKYYIWKIIRSDTLVNDVLFSTSSSAPTMPTSYDYKRRIGEFTRTGGVNGKPHWYGPLIAGSTPETDTSGIVTQWVAYTPTFTGMGTVSSVNVFSRRVGDTLQIRGGFVSGTGTATEGRISLGFNGTNGNVTSDSSKVPTIQLAGSMTFSVAVASILYTLIESAVGYLTIGIQSSGTAGLTKQNGSQVGNSSTISFAADVPIAGW